MNKKILTIILALAFVSLVSVMYANEQSKDAKDSTGSVTEIEAENFESHDDSEDYLWSDSETISIKLNRDSISTNTGSVAVKDNTATIVSAGTYSLSGVLDDGQIIVDTKDEGTVRLILNGASISSSESSPICVKNAEKVIVILTDNTENFLTDGESYLLDNVEDEPNAAIFSKSDLTIYGEGSGSLDVEGNYNDAISSKDGLIIKNATISLTAVDDGIRGKDYLIIENASLSIVSKGDGLKSDNSEDTAKGYISVKDSLIDIISGGDAIAAETDVTVNGGELNLTSGGGSRYSVNGDSSTKGIKSGINLVIENGNITISSSDDALHSNDSLTINDGTIAISSGDDGIHADSSLEINGGKIDIMKSYEGLESAVITINNGEINIVSSDDGINVAGGNDGSAMGRPGQGGFSQASNDYYLYINGGYIYINANGDGLDSNGSIAMTGGTVIVDGPTRNDNGALDYMGTFEITGGLLIAAGSSGMAEAPSQSSSQYSVILNFDSTQSAGTLINIQDSSGNDILTFSPAKQYQSVVFSSPDLEEGETYIAYLGGSSTGKETNGLYQGGKYTSGEQSSSFTVSSVITSVGTKGMQRGDNMMQGDGMMQNNGGMQGGGMRR